MRPALRRLFLSAIKSDALSQLKNDVWQTRCLHCRSRLQVRSDGEALGHASLEHVIPRAWFGKRAASTLTLRVGDDANDARNLAIACKRCNHDKGKGHDARGPNDLRAYQVVETLLQTRMQRWRIASAERRDD